MSTHKIPIKIIPHASSCPNVNEESPTKKQKVIDDHRTVQTLDCLRRAFETQNSAQTILVMVAEEKARHHPKAKEGWQALCKAIFYRHGLEYGFHKEDLLTKSGAKMSPHYFYENYLRQYVGNLFLKTIKVMWALGVFEVYKPEEQPFALFSKQVDCPGDINPRIEAYIPLADLVETGLIFGDIRIFNPVAEVVGFEQATPVCYGLFYSFYTGYNLATAFFRNFRGEWGYRWATYDRLKVGETGSIRNSK